MGIRSQLPRAEILNARRWLLMAALIVFYCGCSRTRYRQAADAESYRLIKSRQSDPRWELPSRRVEPDRTSRMYLANERDCGVKPTDDSAARHYMMHPDGKVNRYYGKKPTRSYVENPAWVDLLPRRLS